MPIMRSLPWQAQFNSDETSKTCMDCRGIHGSAMMLYIGLGILVTLLSYVFVKALHHAIMHSFMRHCMIRNDNGQQPRFKSPRAGLNLASASR